VISSIKQQLCALAAPCPHRTEHMHRTTRTAPHACTARMHRTHSLHAPTHTLHRNAAQRSATHRIAPQRTHTRTHCTHPHTHILHRNAAQCTTTHRIAHSKHAPHRMHLPHIVSCVLSPPGDRPKRQSVKIVRGDKAGGSPASSGLGGIGGGELSSGFKLDPLEYGVLDLYRYQY
jgi:hypothetical protein